MPVESGVTRVRDLNPQWPRNIDIVREGAAHIRNIKSALRQEGQRRVGFVEMWVGELANLPPGYVLCDGQNGTVDMRDRMPLGAGGKWEVGDSGGEAEVTLTVEQMPTHDHPASSGDAGSHSHSASSGNAGGHRHTYVTSSDSGWAGNAREGGTAARRDNNTSLEGSHNHPISISTAPNHTHPVTVGNRGGGEAHNNMPPWRALWFVQRVEE